MIHCVQPENTCSHRWEQGDVVMWDNAAVLHRADILGLPGQGLRLLHRVSVKGPPVTSLPRRCDPQEWLEGTPAASFPSGIVSCHHCGVDVCMRMRGRARGWISFAAPSAAASVGSRWLWLGGQTTYIHDRIHIYMCIDEPGRTSGAKRFARSVSGGRCCSVVGASDLAGRFRWAVFVDLPSSEVGQLENRRCMPRAAGTRYVRARDDVYSVQV